MERQPSWARGNLDATKKWRARAERVERQPPMTSVVKYTINIFEMATSVHIPKDLLEAVDRRARALKISRNKLIIRALEREIEGAATWSPGFFEQLEETDEQLEADVDRLLDAVVGARRSKGPPL